MIIEFIEWNLFADTNFTDTIHTLLPNEIVQMKMLVFVTEHVCDWELSWHFRTAMKFYILISFDFLLNVSILRGSSTAFKSNSFLIHFIAQISNLFRWKFEKSKLFLEKFKCKNSWKKFYLNTKKIQHIRCFSVNNLIKPHSFDLFLLIQMKIINLNWIHC